ncbi:MAG: RDD family protein [Bdellovibrionales bacterium]|nr:RDD family protein [Bdellovibrionales bacterium]
MKCPGCDFVCSDLRDICPECLLDLRPIKNRSGLPVSFPDADYEELVDRVAKKVSKPKPKTSSGGSWFSGIFGRKAKRDKVEMKESPTELLAEQHAQVDPESSALSPNPEVVTDETPESLDEEIFADLTESFLHSPSEPEDKGALEARTPEVHEPPTTKTSIGKPEAGELSELAQEDLELGRLRRGLTDAPKQNTAHEQPLPGEQSARSSSSSHEARPDPTQRQSESSGDETPRPPSLVPEHTEITETEFDLELLFDTHEPPPSDEGPSRAAEPEESEQESAIPFILEPPSPTQPLTDSQPAEQNSEPTDSIPPPPKTLQALYKEPDWDLHSWINPTSYPARTREGADVTTEHQEAKQREPSASVRENPFSGNSEPPLEQPSFSKWVNTQISESRDARRSGEEKGTLYDQITATQSQDHLHPSRSEPDPVFGGKRAAPTALSPLVSHESSERRASLRPRGELAPLFQDALRELHSLSFEEDSFEISFSEVREKGNREDIELFFSLAKDALASPETDLVFQEGKKIEKETLSSEHLDEHVTRAEQAMRAPVFSLKKGSSESSATSLDQTHVEESPVFTGSVPLASGIKRISALAVDLLFLSVLIVLSTAILLQLFDPTAFRSAILFQFETPLTKVSVTHYVIVSVLTWTIFYPIVSSSLFGEQLGHLVSGLQTIRTDGQRATFSDKLSRTLCLPLSLVTFGYFPLFLGRRTLHERLSQTLLIPKEFSS